MLRNSAGHDVHVHLVASTPNATMVEWMPDDHIVNFRRLIDTQLVAEAGNVILPKTPGLGFRFSDEAVAKYGQISEGKSTRWKTLR